MRESLKQERRLASSTSASASIVSGTGVASNIYAFTTYTITVTAKDSSGNNKGTGGRIFLIQISNKWTMVDAYNWNVDSGAKQTISHLIYEKMTDNGDGTYSYNYSVSFDGAITILVKLVTGNGINAVWYSGTTWSGSPIFTTTYPAINIEKNSDTNWVSIPGGSDDTTVYFYSYFKNSCLRNMNIFSISR